MSNMKLTMSYGKNELHMYLPVLNFPNFQVQFEPHHIQMWVGCSHYSPFYLQNCKREGYNVQRLDFVRLGFEDNLWRRGLTFHKSRLCTLLLYIHGLADIVMHMCM